MSSMKVVFLLLAVVAAVHGKASFCRSYDCPDFTSQNGDGYEIRTYTGRTSWVMSSGSGNMFGRLFNYINDNGIKMTVPVLVKKDGSSSDQMYFYLNVDSPPSPTSGSGVSLVYMADKEFYVRTFSKRAGFFNMARSNDFAREARALKAAINDESAYDTSSYYEVSYTSPWYFFRRHYEVWIEKL